jgi:PleD family two-component response regulator
VVPEASGSGSGIEESLPKCSCKARILVVDDTDFNLLAVKLMIKENFLIDVDEAVNG